MTMCSIIRPAYRSTGCTVLLAVCMMFSCLVSTAAIAAQETPAGDTVSEKVTADSVELVSDENTGSLSSEAEAALPAAPRSPFPFKPGHLSEVGSGSNVGSGVVTTNPLSVVVGLLFVVGLILLLAWLMRRMGGISTFNGQQMKVVAALSVAGREKVLLIDVGGQQVLIGVAPGRVSHLQTFEQPVITPSANPSDFPSAMKKILQQNFSGTAGKGGGRE